MADKWPLANGNWSNAANWNDGTKPVAGDDVYADGKTVTIDEDVNIGSGTLRTSQRSGGTNNGGFIVSSSSRTITANITTNATPTLSYGGTGILTFNGNVTPSLNDGITNSSTGTINVNGNVTAASSAASGHGIRNSSTGTINVVGNVTGANNYSYGVNNAANGVVNITGTVMGGFGNGAYGFSNSATSSVSTITGNVFGGSVNQTYGVSNGSTGTVNIIGNVTGGAGTAAYGAYNNTTGVINVTGNVLGGSNSSANGVHNNSSGSVTINGNVTGGSGSTSYGAINSSTGSLIITGNATGGSGSSSHGAVNASTGLLRVYGIAVGNDHGLGYATNNGTYGVTGFGINTGVVQATTTVRGIRYGAKGQSPTAGLVQLDISNLASSSARFRTEPNSFTEYTFGPPENIGGQPAASNVRLGTIYNFGNTTGTLAVPPSGSVALGVPVDNGSGTAILTASDFTAILSANLQPNGPIVVERSKEDTNGITFSWPALGATITGQVSKNNGAYAATAGAISFLRTDGTRYYYTLAYNAADRPPAEGTARYRLTDGTYTKYFTLRVEPSYVANVSVTPGFALQQDPATKQDLLIYTDEEDNFTVDIFRQDGFTPVNLSGMNLQFKVSDLNDQLLYTIGSGNITIGGVDNNQITFPKASLTSNDFEGKWGLRDAANGDKVIAYGRIEILYVP